MGMCVLRALCPPVSLILLCHLTNAPATRPHVLLASAGNKCAIHCLQCNCVPQFRKKTNKQMEHREHKWLFDTAWMTKCPSCFSAALSYVSNITDIAVYRSGHICRPQASLQQENGIHTGEH